MRTWETAWSWLERCLKIGIGEFVVCGGARNAVLLEALARAHEAGVVKVWHHFEERSAAFFALGRTQATGKPCAVVTTSGTAVAECLPAVIEAFFQARPLVVVSADRPERYRGTGAPQTITQPNLFGEYAFSVEDDFGAWNGRGPLHLNLELEEAAQFPAETPAISPVGEAPNRWDRPVVAELARWLRQDRHRGMVVWIGGLQAEEREEVFYFCTELNVPVIAEATSGLREALQALHLPDADRLLPKSLPGKILRLGEVPSGRFWRDLEELTDVSVWSICRNGLPGLARESQVLQGPIHRVLSALGEVERQDDTLDLLVGAARSTDRSRELLEAYPDSEPALMRTVSLYAAMGSSVFLGNSLPIREWNLFAQWDRPVTDVRANRGANGIDGQLSTWLGATASDENAWAVVGDLTTLYDLAAPFVMPQIQAQGRTLAVIHNGGGAIFNRLPRLAELHPNAAAWLTNAHDVSLAGWAEQWGLVHCVIRRSDDFDAWEPGGAATVFEVRPDVDQTTAFWRAWDRLME